jgi:hypothetical protein
MKGLLPVLLITASTAASANPGSEVVCSYAPSQSAVVAAISGAGGGASATAGAIAAATGLTVVPHSSGLLILTGSSGYIAGTIGAPAAAAAAAPVIVGVGLLVGGAAVTVELICARKNHPKHMKQIDEAAAEFRRRFDDAMKRTAIATGDLKRAVGPAMDRSAVEVRRFSVDAIAYANRASAEAWAWIVR